MSEQYVFLLQMTLTLQRMDCAAGTRNVCVQGKELGLLFNASPHSVSLSFTFLSTAVFVNIVRSPRTQSAYPVRSPWSTVCGLSLILTAHKIGLEHDIHELLCCLATIVMKNCAMFQKRIV